LNGTGGAGARQPGAAARGFDDVRASEYEAIRARRRESRGPHEEAIDVPDDLFGVSLSGGGIRSASFCLGALQALDAAGLIRKADYLSTVSGGGYIGASMVAGMTRDNGVFPFHTRDAEGRLARDSEPVSHIRDNSDYLAPEGLGDLLRSLGVVLRGIAVNLVLILAVILLVGLPIVVANPTAEHLGHSVVFDIAGHYFPWLQASSDGGWLRELLADRFILSKILLGILFIWLLVWAMARSYGEAHLRDSMRFIFEPASLGARLSRTLAVMLIVAFVLELQPVIIGWLIERLQGDGVTTPGLQSLGAAALAIVAATATFRERLVAWIERALGSSSYGARLRAAFARVAFLALGLALPLLIYGLFVTIVIWTVALPPDGLRPFAPGLLTGDPGPGIWTLNLAMVLMMGGLVVFKAISAMGLRRTAPALAWAAGTICFLCVGAIATRASMANASESWTVLGNYLFVTLFTIGIGMTFGENANSLHRLYRDRIGAAFRLGSASGPLPLHALGRDAPYLLVNAALNTRIIRHDRPRLNAFEEEMGSDRRSAAAQGLQHGGGAAAQRPTDPARRGRNAEFFLFSRLFTGSDATGYVDSRRMANAEPELDLATAVAISGAAVSSSMGRIGIGLLGPTLALLNLRLGFWLRNPAQLAATRPPQDWTDVLRLYLAQEAFGRMSADRPLVYVTDGGHIDNIGLYQLLRRRCKIVVVVDAEADPGYNFGAFCDVQRFVRIDHGVRVTLDWRPVREAALKRLAKRDEARAKDDPLHDRHFAVGRIKYDDGTPDGFLLYVKASMTGDEPDYVLDYERRYPLFPHESTGDQFFSEEQMEAYRALGFHAMERALDPEGSGWAIARPETSIFKSAPPSTSSRGAPAADVVSRLRGNLAGRAPPPKGQPPIPTPPAT
jgi:hypothetical protein